MTRTRSARGRRLATAAFATLLFFAVPFVFSGGTARAGAGHARSGELTAVHEEERRLVIDGTVYAVATSLRPIDADGRSMSLEDLSDRPSARVVFTTRPSRPDPMIVTLHVLGEPTE